MAELTPAEKAVVGDVPEALVSELADAFWRIEGNYNRESSGPGSRFDGQRLEFALALFAVRQCRRAFRPRIEAEAAALVRDLVDPDACWYDHHGYCQAHGWMAVEPVCPHKRAQDYLDQIEGGSDGA